MINKIPPKSVHFDNTVHARFGVNTLRGMRTFGQRTIGQRTVGHGRLVNGRLVKWIVRQEDY